MFIPLTSNDNKRRITFLPALCLSLPVWVCLLSNVAQFTGVTFVAAFAPSYYKVRVITSFQSSQRHYQLQEALHIPVVANGLDSAWPCLASLLGRVAAGM